MMVVYENGRAIPLEGCQKRLGPDELRRSKELERSMNRVICSESSPESRKSRGGDPEPQS